MSDLIDRQAAVEIVTQCHHKAMSGSDWIRMQEACVKLADLPTAQPHSNDSSATRKALDCISRQAAIDAFTAYSEYESNRTNADWVTRIHTVLRSLPPAQPEVIFCKDCAKHNKARGYHMDGTFIGVKDCCPLVEIRGIAQGHEFDYQFCVYAERKSDERPIP